MPVKIYDIEKNSVSYNAGIQPSELLLSINAHEIEDVLDYRFYQVDKKLELVIQDINGNNRTVLIKKSEYEELGLVFETYLMDKQKHCKNKCIFCFIDQLPNNMRESLYFKDDDSRLSFLFGNYITLTNLSEHELNRIINLHISPINISVHTTNPELRNKMMCNRFAGQSLDKMYILAKSGIKINCQIVVCPEINDGDNLIETLEKLKSLYPSVQSVSVVPVGLTKYRDNLYPLRGFTELEAKKVLGIVQDFSNKCLTEIKTRLVFCADEIYLKAKIPIPTADYYEDFEQLENGVGMLSLFRDEFENALDYAPKTIPNRKITVATGVSAFDFMKNLLNKIKSKYSNFECNVICVKNDFFGETITVSGLLTGIDLKNSLKNIDLGDELLISKSMLKHNENIFLDDYKLETLENDLNVKITPTENNGEVFLNNLLGGAYVCQ